MKTITAIIPSFRRHENIPIIVDRLKKQSYKPDRIIIWNDNSGKYGKAIVIGDKSIEVINTNSNWWSNYGSYLIGYLTNTDYIAIIDDDMPPGPEWFEYCISKQEKFPGIYGKYGVIFKGKSRYIPNEHFSSNIGNGELREVDMVGNSYFVPYKAINCMLYERPPTFNHTCDLHLSYCAQKYGKFKCYIPFPEKETQLPYYKPEELFYSKNDRAMWDDPTHFTNRDGYVRWAVKRGWNIINFRK